MLAPHLLVEEILPYICNDIVTHYRCRRVNRELYICLRDIIYSLTYDDLWDLHIQNGRDSDVTDRYLSKILQYKAIPITACTHDLHSFVAQLELKRSSIYCPYITYFIYHRCTVTDAVLDYIVTCDNKVDILYNMMKSYCRHDDAELLKCLCDRDAPIFEIVYSKHSCITFYVDYISLMIHNNKDITEALDFVGDTFEIIFYLMKKIKYVEIFFSADFIERKRYKWDMKIFMSLMSDADDCMINRIERLLEEQDIPI